ncbi:MAG TPA: Gfo/Idh/MocA family oxidoreductase, partial [Gemmatimonadaceae bacterium]|nr:Gfo/Idh/MocA family oxidoreductase [Gemmatimonadaceae bacterium]
DVDSNVLTKSAAAVAKANPQGKAPKQVGGFRRILDDPAVDAIVIATPDHWHTPMTMLAVNANKHVYLEKPSGHDAREDELVVESTAKHGRLVQLGAQRRSGPKFFEALQALKDGVIGTPYLARTWYANTRTGIGIGTPAPVPANLDYELWQGPAPRTPYRSNIIHYNWHWFTNWGTGEICNNGTHEIDVARWMLGVDYPTSVMSTGHRFHFKDDWQFPDTQEATFEFEGGKMIIWHGQSCNGLPMYGRSRGTAVLGSGGSLVIDQDGYSIYDVKNKLVKESIAKQVDDALNTSGDDALTTMHMNNFLESIRGNAKLNLPISDGAKTGMLCHLGTIAHQTGRKLKTDPKNGHIIGDPDAARLWGRQYENGWTPVI